MLVLLIATMIIEFIFSSNVVTAEGSLLLVRINMLPYHKNIIIIMVIIMIVVHGYGTEALANAMKTHVTHSVNPQLKKAFALCIHALPLAQRVSDSTLCPAPPPPPEW